MVRGGAGAVAEVTRPKCGFPSIRGRVPLNRRDEIASFGPLRFEHSARISLAALALCAVARDCNCMLQFWTPPIAPTPHHREPFTTTTIIASTAIAIAAAIAFTAAVV